MTNATYTKPRHVATSVKSATQSWFGRAAVNGRCTRSGEVAHSPVAGRVVRTVAPRTTPWSPAARITRSMVQRAATIPSRRSWCHTLRAPYTSWGCV
jgi:hypothetical protein